MEDKQMEEIMKNKSEGRWTPTPVLYIQGTNKYKQKCQESRAILRS